MREHNQDRNRSVPLGLSRDIYIDDLTIMSVLLTQQSLRTWYRRMQKFLHAASAIYHEVLYNIYSGARVTDVPYIHIYCITLIANVQLIYVWLAQARRNNSVLMVSGSEDLCINCECQC